MPPMHGKDPFTFHLMNICVLTLFPDLLRNFAGTALLGKAIENNLCSVEAIPIRDFADAPHFHVDDTPYGGGPGMVMRPEPLARAIEAAKTKYPQAKVLLCAANGRRFTQEKAREYASKAEDLIIICGRYEGVDERVRELFVDEEISIGDYVLMGGEVAAMACIEAITRLLPGVLGNPESCSSESFTQADELEGPQYTRPPEFRGLTVPEVLRSGDHAVIENFRREHARKKRALNRPDLE